MSEHINPDDQSTRTPGILSKVASVAASSVRGAIRKNPTANKVYRTGIGVAGGATVALGVALMPLPGPGSLIALGGLGILSTEFKGAKKTRDVAVTAAKQSVKTGRVIKAHFAKKPGNQPNPNHGKKSR